MPRKEIDYSKTVIYKIVCRDVNVKDLYVGATTEFTKRKYAHKQHCTNPKSQKHDFYVYKFIRDNGGWENWDMIEICKYANCKDANEQAKRERHFIEGLKATLNKLIPSRTNQEFCKQYYEKHKDTIKDHVRKYREENTDKIKLRKKEYAIKYKEAISEKRKHTTICECGKEYTIAHKQRHLRSNKHMKYEQQQNQNN